METRNPIRLMSFPTRKLGHDSIIIFISETKPSTVSYQGKRHGVCGAREQLLVLPTTNRPEEDAAVNPFPFSRFGDECTVRSTEHFTGPSLRFQQTIVFSTLSVKNKKKRCQNSFIDQ